MADDFCVQHIDQPFDRSMSNKSNQRLEMKQMRTKDKGAGPSKKGMWPKIFNWTNENGMAFIAAIGQVWMVNVEW